MTRYLLRNIFIVAILVVPALAATAQDGSASYNFLNVTSSSRIFGLGGVNISTVENDLATTDQNPGLLGPEMNNQISVNYMRYLGDSNFGGARYTHAAGERGAWALGFRYFGYGRMKAADEMGNITHEFSPNDFAVTGTYAHDIYGYFRGGVSVKFIYSAYEHYTAVALATDLGFNYYNPDKDLSLSLVAANLGGQLKRFHENYNRLPIDLRLGWSQSFGSFPVRFSVTAWNLTKWNLPYYRYKGSEPDAAPELQQSFVSNLFRHLIFGADFIPNDRFYVALGYNYKSRTDMATYSRSFISGFSIAAGLNVSKFGVDLAFAQPHSGGTSLMVNLRLNLDDLLNL